MRILPYLLMTPSYTTNILSDHCVLQRLVGVHSRPASVCSRVKCQKLSETACQCVGRKQNAQQTSHTSQPRIFQLCTRLAFIVFYIEEGPGLIGIIKTWNNIFLGEVLGFRVLLVLLPTARDITLNPVVEKFLTAWRIALRPSIPVWGQTTSNMSLKQSRKVCTPPQVNARLKRMMQRNFLNGYNNGWIVFCSSILGWGRKSEVYQIGAASIVRTMRSMFMLAARYENFLWGVRIDKPCACKAHCIDLSQCQMPPMFRKRGKKRSPDERAEVFFIFEGVAENQTKHGPK